MGSVARDILGQSTWLMLSRIGGAALQALALAILARSVSPADFGLLNGVLGILLVLSAIAGLGVGPYALRTHSALGYLPRQAVHLNWVSSFGLFGVSVCLLLASSVTSLAPSSIILSLLPLGLWVAAEKNSEVWSSMAIATGKSQVTAVALFAKRALTVLLLGLFLIANWTAPLAYTASIALSALASNALLRIRLRGSRILDTDGMSLWDTTRAAFPYLLNSIGAHLRNLDVTLVGMVAGAGQGGVYALPARLISPLLLVPQALSPVILRYSAAGGESAATTIRRISGAVVFAMACLGIVLAYIVPLAIPAALGSAYTQAVRPAQVLCLGIIGACVVTFLTSILQGRGDAKYVGRVSLVVSAVLFVFLALGAVIGGALGATVGLTLSYLVHVLLLGMRFRRPPSQGMR